MSRFVIATWNINSIRLRIHQVVRYLEEHCPDVLCLQETKTPDEYFPAEPLAQAGYPYQVRRGMKSYNGVAIVSRLPIEATGGQDWCGREDCRHVSARIKGLEIHNLYIPAGGDVPDPQLNEKFAHKLQFIDELTSWLAASQGGAPPTILLGDFNIAPLEQDVWSHKALLNVVSHTAVEIERLACLQATAGWVDAVRHFVPADQKLYSWWSYRARDWQASDRGRRLDHIWVSPQLRPQLDGYAIAKPVRGWLQASDHVPVSIALNLPSPNPPSPNPP